MLAGFGDGGKWTYGDMTVIDPKQWQVLLLLAALAVTMVPSWWMLQRARESQYLVTRVRDSGGFEMESLSRVTADV